MGTWGYTGTGSNQANWANIDLGNICDQFTTAGQQLDSLHFYAVDASATLRIALYSATDPDDMTTADLVEDLGEFTTSAGWNQINSVTNPAIPQNEYPVIVVKDNTNGTHYADEEPIPGESQVYTHSYNCITDDASNVAFQATLSAGNAYGSALSMYLTYSAAGSGPATPTGQVIATVYNDIR